jgi:hypothetical protein
MREDIGISTIFNVENLYPYRIYRKEEEEYEDKVWWMQQIPIVENIQITNILDQRIAKRTRREVYYEYLVKWKNHPIEYVRWLT